MFQSKRIKTQFLGLVSVGILIMGCQNLFNPSGTGDSVDLDADGLISYGQTLLQQGDNKEAIGVFEKAIQQDSSKSLAYYGLSKAILRADNFNPVTVSEAMIGMTDPNSDPLTALTELVGGELGENLPAIRETNAVLKKLIRRDSINSLWITYQQLKKYEVEPVSSNDSVSLSSEAKADSTQLADYKLYYYLYHTPENPIYKPNEFPIMDGNVTSTRVNPEFQLLTMISAAGVANEAGAFLGDEDFINNVANGEMDLTNIEEDNVEDFNALLDLAAEDINAISFSSDLLATESGDTVDTEDPEVQQEIDRVKANISFYKIADKIDNDGDGCVDEEIRDGIDNDGDGIIDEDSRFTIGDLVDNNVNSTVDEASEQLDGSQLLPSEFGYNYNGQYIVYLDSLDELTTDEKNQRRTSADSVRNLIVNDTEKAISRATRRALIGGCW